MQLLLDYDDLIKIPFLESYYKEFNESFIKLRYVVHFLDIMLSYCFWTTKLHIFVSWNYYKVNSLCAAAR